MRQRGWAVNSPRAPEGPEGVVVGGGAAPLAIRAGGHAMLEAKDLVQVFAVPEPDHRRQVGDREFRGFKQFPEAGQAPGAQFRADAVADLFAEGPLELAA